MGPQRQEEERAEYIVGWASLQLPDLLDDVVITTATNGEEDISKMVLYITARPNVLDNVKSDPRRK